MTATHFLLVLGCGHVQTSPVRYDNGATVECRHAHCGHVSVVSSHERPGAFEPVLMDQVRGLIDRVRMHMDYLAEIKRSTPRFRPAEALTDGFAQPWLDAGNLELTIGLPETRALIVQTRMDVAGIRARYGTEELCRFTWQPEPDDDGHQEPRRFARLVVEMVDGPWDPELEPTPAQPETEPVNLATEQIRAQQRAQIRRLAEDQIERGVDEAGAPLPGAVATLDPADPEPTTDTPQDDPE